MAGTVEVFDPAYRAHELRIEKKTWREIAELTGYPNELAARAAVTAYLVRAGAELYRGQQAERLAAELERLEDVEMSFWAAMRSGDEKAAAVILNVIRTRAKLLGLETKEAEAATTRTVVIAGSAEEYVASLRRLVEDDTPGHG